MSTHRCIAYHRDLHCLSTVTSLKVGNTMFRCFNIDDSTRSIMGGHSMPFCLKMAANLGFIRAYDYYCNIGGAGEAFRTTVTYEETVLKNRSVSLSYISSSARLTSYFCCLSKTPVFTDSNGVDALHQKKGRIDKVCNNYYRCTR